MTAWSRAVVPVDRPERVTVIETPEEFATIAHMRMWCHDSTLCLICRAEIRAERRGYDRAIREIAEG